MLYAGKKKDPIESRTSWMRLTTPSWGFSAIWNVLKLPWRKRETDIGLVNKKHETYVSMIIDTNLFRMFCSWRTFFYSSFSPKMSSIFRLSSCMCSIRHPWGKTQDYCFRDLVGSICAVIHWEPLYIENCLLTSYPDSSLRFPLHLLPASLCLGVSLGLVYFFFEDQLAMDHMVLALFKCFCCVMLIVKSFVL